MTRYLLLLALCATPALAEEGPSDADYNAFVEAVTANDCEMTQGEAEVLLPAVGIDQDTSGLIASELIAEGDAELSDDGETFTLLTEGCEE